MRSASFTCNKSGAHTCFVLTLLHRCCFCIVFIAVFPEKIDTDTRELNRHTEQSFTLTEHKNTSRVDIFATNSKLVSSYSLQISKLVVAESNNKRFCRLLIMNTL